MAYGVSNGHVTDDITWPPKMPQGSTIGYPSDSLASCFTSICSGHRNSLCFLVPGQVCTLHAWPVLTVLALQPADCPLTVFYLTVHALCFVFSSFSFLMTVLRFQLVTCLYKTNNIKHNYVLGIMHQFYLWHCLTNTWKPIKSRCWDAAINWLCYSSQTRLQKCITGSIF